MNIQNTHLKTLKSKISRCSAAATLSIRGGITLVPIVKVPTINPVATIITTAIDSIETVPTNATDCKDEIKITAITSSTINMPSTRIEDSVLIRPISSRIFTIIAVLEN